MNMVIRERRTRFTIYLVMIKCLLKHLLGSEPITLDLPEGRTTGTGSE
jgi:hypothetical protein